MQTYWPYYTLGNDGVLRDPKAGTIRCDRDGNPAPVFRSPDAAERWLEEQDFRGNVRPFPLVERTS